jgi:hypothetical protein
MMMVSGYPVLRDTVVVRVSTEEQAIGLIEELKQKQSEEGYTITKSGYVLKTKKAKGEIIDSWYVVTCQKDYDDE